MAVKYETPWMGGGAQQANLAITVYEPDGTTEAAVFTDTAGTAGTNPVNTDASGVLHTYLNPGRYVLKDTHGQESGITVAPSGADTPALPDITGVKATDAASILGQILAAGEAKNLWTDSTT